ncbi:ubiquitin-conjugating enzyme E2 G1 [Pancytospora epiphaga]|nr:ubiquitin-conjugating enzyme E2 G1 [Pancytospora epiphaga]
MALNDKSRSEAYILKDYKRIMKDGGCDDFSVGLIDDSLHAWKVVLIGPRDTPYESGIYEAEMVFPFDYPEAPPKFRFISPMWHPNIDKDGNVCISILHKPGEDEFGYEDLSERWLPVRTPESVILSILHY